MRSKREGGVRQVAGDLHSDVKAGLDFPYFEQRRQVDPPRGHFEREFIWFHRPLSDYWKAFRAAGGGLRGVAHRDGGLAAKLTPRAAP